MIQPDHPTTATAAATDRTRDHSPRTVSIRRAHAADASVLAELGARTFRDTYLADMAAEDVEDFIRRRHQPDLLAAALTEPTNCYFVAEVAGIPAGFALLRDDSATEVSHDLPGSRPMALAELYVDRRYLSAGIGAALMRHCVGWARANGHGVLWLTVWERNQRAVAFYRRWGFVDAGETVFVAGNDRQRDLVLALPLR